MQYLVHSGDTLAVNLSELQKVASHHVGAGCWIQVLRKEWPVVLTSEPSPQPLSFELCSVSMETTADLCWNLVSYLAIEMSVQWIWGGHLPLFLQALPVPCSLFLLDYAGVGPMVLFIFISLRFFLPHLQVQWPLSVPAHTCWWTL